MRTTTTTVVRLVAILAAVIAPVGCSSAGDGPTPAAAQTAAPSATPTTPLPPTREQAAQIYLKAVTPANAAAKALGNAMDAKKGMGTIRGKAKAAAAANRKFLDVLIATQWPKPVQTHIDEVARSTATSQTMFENVARARTRREAEDIVSSTPFDNTSAQLVRAALGLPPAK